MGLFTFKKKEGGESSPNAQQVGPESVPQPPSFGAPSAMPQEQRGVGQAPVAPQMGKASSSEPFSLPDLPPMPDYGQQVSPPTMGGQKSVMSNEPPLGMTQPPLDSDELPELPELPSFENHPELEMIDELPDSESIAPLDEDPVAMVSSPVTGESKADEPRVNPNYNPHPKPGLVNGLPPGTDPLLYMSKVDPTKPIFMDVEEYQDLIQDMNMTRADLQHIHEKSGLADKEAKIDSIIGSFRTTVLQSKKQLNHIDELLFVR